MKAGTVKQALNDAPHCGDECGYWKRGSNITLCVVDGLGHGEYAEKAAKAAMGYVSYHLSKPLPEIIAGCDSEIRRTRGVAMSIALIDEEGGALTYAGVGNTRAMIVREPAPEFPQGKSVRFSNSFGIVGGGFRPLFPETVKFKPGDLLIMYTDGIKEMIDLSGYGEEERSDLRGLAERIIEDFSSRTDDAAILIVST